MIASKMLIVSADGLAGGMMGASVTSMPSDAEVSRFLDGQRSQRSCRDQKPQCLAALAPFPAIAAISCSHFAEAKGYGDGHEYQTTTSHIISSNARSHKHQASISVKSTSFVYFVRYHQRTGLYCLLCRAETKQFAAAQLKDATISYDGH